MPKRGPSAPQKIQQPRYLCLLDGQAEEPTLLVDSYDGRHFRLTGASAKLVAARIATARVKGAQSTKRPRAGGFDWLFRRHKDYFAPLYGEPEDAFEVFRAWAFAHACRRFLPVRPIALFTGPPGATKSTTASAVAQLWFGEEAVCARPVRVPDTQRDILGDFRHSPILILDNLEAAPKWLADTLCIVTSDDGLLGTRELYTTAGRYGIVPDCFVCVTSVSARGFIRGDLLARSLVFNMRPPPEGYMARAVWSRDIVEARTAFWSEMLGATRAVLRALQGGCQSGVRAFDRLQDFAWVGTAICGAAGGGRAVLRFRRGMAAIALSRVALAAADPEVEALVGVAAQDGAEAKWYSAADLLRACAEVQQIGDRGYDLTLRSAESFGKWLASATAKAAGLLRLDRRLLNGRTLWRVQLPDWAVEAAELLRVPVAAPTNGAVAGSVAAAALAGPEEPTALA